MTADHSGLAGGRSAILASQGMNGLPPKVVFALRDFCIQGSVWTTGARLWWRLLLELVAAEFRKMGAPIHGIADWTEAFGHRRAHKYGDILADVALDVPPEQGTWRRAGETERRACGCELAEVGRFGTVSASIAAAVAAMAILKKARVGPYDRKRSPETD